ncbi:MAG TPA: MIP/aquaporin family protein [Thermoplasmata archaeon]|nr:MIP/aquaporin family protein [Thermoplasmata archaeon]
MNRPLLLRCLAEVGGTAALVGIGTGAIVAGANAGGVAQWVLALAWFAAVAIPVLAFAAVSGAHLNPVVTLGLMVDRRFPSREIAPYAGAQFAGAFTGTLLVRAALGTGAHLGSTLSRAPSLVDTFLLEFAFTAALVLSVLVIVRLGPAASRWWLLVPPAVVGISTFVIGPWTGSSLNPARSIAPAVISQSFDGLWVYLLATPLAALAVALSVRRSGASRSEAEPAMPAAKGEG